MKNFLIIILLFGVNVFLHKAQAQDIKKDFKQVYDGYLKMNYYSQDVMVSSFLKKEDTKPFYEKKGKIVKGEKVYYSLFDGQKTIINNTEVLYINDNSKQMIYYNLEKVDDAVMAKQYQQILDTASITNSTFVSENSGIRTYRINYPNELINIVDISLDMKNMMIKKIVYYYKKTDEDNKEGQYKSIVEYVLTSREKPSESLFDLTKYVLVKNKKASLQESYRNYHLTQKNEKTFKSYESY